MTAGPLVSVVVTCYNQQDVIARTIQSVTTQTLEKLQCIVVDDGSIDNSAEVIREAAHRDSRVKLLGQTNSGVSAARNAGFAAARGQFIQFLDGDDTLHPEKLARHMEHFSDNEGLDVSYSRHQFYDAAANKISTFAFDPLKEFPLEQMLFQWFDKCTLPVHAPLFRRSLWAETELPYPNDYFDRCEDWVFLVLVAMKNARFAMIDEVLCTYHIDTQNFTASQNDWNTASIVAANYLKDRIPPCYRESFFKPFVARTLDRYHESLKPDVLRASKNWQLGNSLTSPFFSVLKLFRPRS